MANVQGAFGLKRWGTSGGAPSFSQAHDPPYRISSSGGAIYFGDLVRMNVSGPTGYIEQWANGDGSTATKILVGVFLGCSYYSTGQQRTVFNRYWPGSDATGDVHAFVCDEPNSEWVIQSGVTSAAITQTSLGQTADVVASPTGNTTTGISGMSLAAPTTSNVLPLKVVNLVTTPPGANGTDLTTAFNYVIVTFNNQTFKALLGV